MYIAMIAPLDKRSINLFDALNANYGSKINFQELASNEHICSVEGHVVAIEAKGNASENRVTYEGDVLLVIDASELLCLDTKDIASGPDPIHHAQPSQLQGPIKRLFIPVVRTLEPYIPKFRSGNDFVVGGRNRNILLVDFGENPVVPPIDCDVGTIDSATFASFLHQVCLVVGEYLPHLEKNDANEAGEV